MVLERELDVVANNVANANTTGFKAENAMFEQYVLRARENRFESPDRQVRFVLDRATWHNFEPGAVQQTGNPLDIAIDGDGFLPVQTPNGQRYTRNGALRLDGQGQLVTMEGYPVAGENGPIVFQDTDHDIAIAPDGRVTVIAGVTTNNAETQRGRIPIVRFDTPQLLQKEGNNVYSAPGLAPLPDTQSQVRQGFIEKSNVNSVVEMTRLIQVSREYQRVATLLQAQSDMHKSAIHDLANVPS
jgi:flagellar basal-body rod protein FlgF/flagellar basal-body rod protein FlgG